MSRADILIEAWGLDPAHAVSRFLAGLTEVIPEPPEDSDVRPNKEDLRKEIHHLESCLDAAEYDVEEEQRISRRLHERIHVLELEARVKALCVTCGQTARACALSGCC